MADTGAPWNLPYPLPTDLVRDGAQAIEDLAEATATGLSLAGNEGIGPNVVEAVSTTTFSTSSTSFQDVTGLSATITPSSATSKILVMAYMSIDNTESDGSEFGAAMRLLRGTTAIFVGTDVGNRVAAAAGTRNRVLRLDQTEMYVAPVFVDSPNTTSATTYKVQIRASGDGTAVVGRSGNDTNSTSSVRTASSLVVIEVAA